MCEIHRIKCGNVNCYILKNGSSAILVDTGKKEHFQQVLEACKAFHVKLIVLTHAHFDHAENAAQLSSTLDIPIGMHESAPLQFQSSAFRLHVFRENRFVRITQGICGPYSAGS